MVATMGFSLSLRSQSTDRVNVNPLLVACDTSFVQRSWSKGAMRPESRLACTAVSGEADKFGREREERAALTRRLALC